MSALAESVAPLKVVRLPLTVSVDTLTEPLTVMLLDTKEGLALNVPLTTQPTIAGTLLTERKPPPGTVRVGMIEAGKEKVLNAMPQLPVKFMALITVSGWIAAVEATTASFRVRLSTVNGIEIAALD